MKILESSVAGCIKKTFKSKIGCLYCFGKQLEGRGGGSIGNGNACCPERMFFTQVSVGNQEQGLIWNPNRPIPTQKKLLVSEHYFPG